MKHKYLFVLREGSSNIFVSETAPTAEDIVRVQVGLLDIIRLSDLQVMTRSGFWRRVDDGVVHTAIIDGQKTPPFHVPIAWGEEEGHNAPKN